MSPRPFLAALAMRSIQAYAKGVHLSAYTTIGGTHMFQPAFYSLVQTDGSYYHKSKYSRVSNILTTASGNEVYKRMFEISDAVSSTETKWASVYHGLQFAIEKAQTLIAIENDNLGVVAALTVPNTNVRQEYAKYYKYSILRMTKQTAWTGIRWIPREKNRADALF